MSSPLSSFRPLALMLIACLWAGAGLAAEPDLAAIRAEVGKQHAANIARLQSWIALPAIAA